MKSLTLSAVAVSLAVTGFAGGAQAQQAKKLFFEGDIVRHALAEQAGPFCVLANQFTRKEAVAWRIRVLQANGEVADDKVLKSVVVELGNGMKLPAGLPAVTQCAVVTNGAAAAMNTTMMTSLIATMMLLKRADSRMPTTSKAMVPILRKLDR